MPDRPGMGATKELNDFYLRGKGSGWKSSPTPYRTLLAMLLKYMSRDKAEGYAARLYHAAFGKWPGRR